MDILRILRGDEAPPAAAAAVAPEARQPRPSAPPAPRLDLAAVRERLAGERGRDWWRSLEDLAATPEFEEMLHRELPRLASEWAGGRASRRRFLQLSSASLALGGLAGCVKQPPEKIVPYVVQPEGLVPGESLHFATAIPRGGYATGLLVESAMGRPVKVEGNPEHPASLGATDLFDQAAILDLYDPDRLQAVTQLGRTRTWDAFVAELGARLTAQEALGGAGLAILTEDLSSPTAAAQLDALRGRFPRLRRHVWEPAGRHAAEIAARRAFGAPLEARYDLSRASVVLALDSDFLTQGPGAVRYARDFTARRRVWDGADADPLGMLRLYSVESDHTATGAKADHRLPLPPSGVAAFAAALAAELGAPGAAAAGELPHPDGARWLGAVAEDLRRAGPAALVVPGDYAPPAVHVVAHAINAALGAAGSTVVYGDPIAARPSEPEGAAIDDPAASLAELTRAMAAGEVDLLLILGGNPVFTAPADLGFAEALAKVPLRVHHTLAADETSGWCQWLLPAAHPLEGWSDARAFDGTASIVQPLIEPLYGPAKTVHQVLAAMAGDGAADSFEPVRAHWRENGLADEAAWRRAVHDGMVPGTSGPGTASPGQAAAPPADAVARAAREAAGMRPAAVAGALELSFRPDPTIWDGRFANNAWLQECPKPISKLAWDNALLLGPAEAAERGLASGDLVEIATRERTLQAAVWIQPGQARGSATLHLGYGRTAVGRVGAGAGFDAFRLRNREGFWTVPATVSAPVGRYRLASSQDHGSMEGRHLVRSAPLDEYRAHPDFAQHVVHVPRPDETMYPGWSYDGYKWGLSIDLAACTGCNACLVACVAENNIPAVGKEQMLNGREMHWLRLDRYFGGDVDEPEVVFQPMMCQHCEQAPCEVVCPVAATVHSAEGLNDMVYNRCVGTRYCSNNCPYKVRRFNFLKWVDTETEVLKLARNPEVTVRSRGVMEKCTFCVQRINHAPAGRQGRGTADPRRRGQDAPARRSARRTPSSSAT